MSVTIKDIAKLAGVSHTTVSRALNNSPLIQEETKERIRQIAKQMDYTPNYSAKSLVLDRSYNLGLFFTTLSKGTSAGFFYEAIRGVNSVIQDRYQLIVKGIDDYTSFQSITRKSFDGIIVVSQSDDDQSIIEHIAGKGIPLVVLNRPVSTAGVLNVLSDEEQGAFLASSYLIEQGHKRIALIEGRKGFKSAQNRKDGFERAMRHYGVTIPESYRFPGLYDLESGHHAMQQFLKLAKPPTAVFSCNDEMALGAIKAISEAGLQVPADISVVGFDDTVFAAYVTPALTTVRRPIEQISKEGAIRLLDNIENKHHETEQVLLKTELIVRESVKQLSI
ncbi:LacI family DNA-binding transcriptional regulator [Bacillus sp. 3255]|uniref:LacI family DNA-binding transcriptional regulator n=1 Tax=Bacillus sp. 3255 TaxID=2817904 RepID=UPI00286057FF|nr:LacI family DNA-binding transcriptional regulator [Bacillus sp. 3255]MDR6880256.1 LacI family transcriptional regulator [Bacillus sp. 3255]